MQSLHNVPVSLIGLFVGLLNHLWPVASLIPPSAIASSAMDSNSTCIKLSSYKWYMWKGMQTYHTCVIEEYPSNEIKQNFGDDYNIWQEVFFCLFVCLFFFNIMWKFLIFEIGYVVPEE